MAQIKIDLPTSLLDGMDIKFKAPCDCTAVTGLLVYYPTEGEEMGSKSFTFRDSHGNDLSGLGNLFSAGAYVKAILDTENGYAYLQNADTNAYLEGKKKAVAVTLSVEGWASNSQTVSVSGVKVDNDVIIGAAPENHTEYGECGVYCSAQAEGTLTFTCTDTPGNSLAVNVIILN